MSFPVPENEEQRLVTVQDHDIYGTEPEGAFDDLTDLTAQLTGAPISLVSIVGDEQIWIKSRHGVPTHLSEMPRDALCCTHAICDSDMLVVPDTLADERFKDKPLIATDPHVRFYAVMPLMSTEGHALGTLCIMDTEPRELSWEHAEGIRRLARQTVAQLELRMRLAEIKRTQHQLAREKARADRLILNILPKGVAEKLSTKGRFEPRHHASTTIMFTDFERFTQVAEELSPRELIDELHVHFSAFDEISNSHGLEKLKTIGDGYMCAGGLTRAGEDHAGKTCLAALEMQRYMVNMNREQAARGRAIWRLRIGVHTGSVISGVVGKDKFSYDVWGDTVNVAARMEAYGQGSRINVSDSIYEQSKHYLSMAETKCASWRSNSVPVWLVEKGLKALVLFSCAACIEARGA